MLMIDLICFVCSLSATLFTIVQGEVTRYPTDRDIRQVWHGTSYFHGKLIGIGRVYRILKERRQMRHSMQQEVCSQAQELKL